MNNFFFLHMCSCRVNLHNLVDKICIILKVFWIGWPNLCIYDIKLAAASDLRTRYYLVFTTNTNCHFGTKTAFTKTAATGDIWRQF